MKRKPVKPIELEEPQGQPVPDEAITDIEFEGTDEIKKEYARVIREKVQQLQSIVRQATKVGLAVKINIEAPAPHTAANQIATVSITETKNW